MPTPSWSIVLTDALEKIYPDAAPRPLDASIGQSVFLGEPFSFQVAVRPPADHGFRTDFGVQIHIGGEAGQHAALHQVDLAPVTLASFPGVTEGFDRVVPGLYPDVLRPVADGRIKQIYGHWTSAWVDVTVTEAKHAGLLEVPVRVTDAEGEALFEQTLQLQVIDRALPELGLVNSHWFHCDGLASYYDVEVFGEDHWIIIDEFLGSAAKMRVNSILTPTWTPPLDTEVGGLRLPTQLIGIKENGVAEGSRYSFDFDHLVHWMELCEKHGIHTLEIAHLFTQWGANATPAIYVDTQNGQERRFGWDVPADSPEYRALMSELLPQLRAVLAERWSLDRVIFHISDEPHGEKALASYKVAKAQVADLLEGLTVVDALSDFDFYQTGTVPQPIVATDAVGPFFEAGVERPWVYYCVAQDRGVANRFIAMPSVRNRVLGHQLFAKDCGGFLHWGFNFYNSQYSLAPINPFLDTCAGGGFPGGDSFMVYPGADGTPWESVRFKVFAQAMDDHRAFSLLAELSGRDTVMALIDTNGDGGTLEMDSFSYDPLHYRRVREGVNQAIVAALAAG